MKLRPQTKDLCTVRRGTVQRQTKAFYFVALKFSGFPEYHLDRLAMIIVVETTNLVEHNVIQNYFSNLLVCKMRYFVLANATCTRFSCIYNGKPLCADYCQLLNSNFEYFRMYSIQYRDCFSLGRVYTLIKRQTRKQQIYKFIRKTRHTRDLYLS